MNSIKGRKKEVLKVYWYKHPSGIGNYGDELGPFIIKRLSGLEVEYSDIIRFSAGTSIKKFLTNPMTILRSLRNILYRNILGPKVIVSAGSILAWFNYRNAIIWGSGVMKANDKIYKATFYAVRGEYTKSLVQRAGFRAPLALGDPGLLLPLVYPPVQEKKYKIGLIPHYVHYKELKANINNPEILVIDMLESVENVTNAITSCEVTLSSSLHGIIVSHAYEIPSVWVKWSNQDIAGDNTKFRDYFSSVRIKEYNPVLLFDKTNLNNPSLLLEIISDNNSIAIPENRLVKLLQKALIQNAPFTVLERFR